MKHQGFHLDTFNLVGHSLGCQVVGLIGRNVYEKSQKTTSISRLTALDPAGPLIYKSSSVFHKNLNQNDGNHIKHSIKTNRNLKQSQLCLSMSSTLTIHILEFRKKVVMQVK